MQNRYTGDIGDYAKYGLLRALCTGHRLGVAWYLYPDESHSEGGRHIGYLDEPDKWRHLDPELFDYLRSIIQSNRRSGREVEESGLLGDALFSNAPLTFDGTKPTRGTLRARWFQDVLSELQTCNVLFADPDNGLCEDHKYTMEDKINWKRIPLSEAHVLSAGRTGILYHHNSRFAGGHAKEIQYWLQLLGADAFALYWRRISPRTFFIVHPTTEIIRRAQDFMKQWSAHFELHTQLDVQVLNDSSHQRPAPQEDRCQKACPECGHTFTGRGWGGIDAHWKSHHENIMPYSEAWPMIRAGKIPSNEIE